MKKYVLCIFCFILGGISYRLFFNPNTPVQRDLKNYQSSAAVRKNAGSKLISPLLLTGDSKASYVNDDFTKKVSDYITSQKEAGNASAISFYVKNLRNSSWTGIEEDAHYSPASLMKVPVLIAILKESESNPNFLKKQVHYTQTGDYNTGEHYLPKKRILPNRNYSIEELLNYMVDYSDNNATLLLLSQIPQKNIVQIFTDLELPLPENGTNAAIDFMSAKLYSRLFRVLYNSTYLNEENSVKALDLLSNIDFSSGIVSGVPEEIDVANKFGERTVNDQTKNISYKELHDCGIVYLPDNPYAICIMTKGSDFSKLESIISEISRMTYEKMR